MESHPFGQRREGARSHRGAFISINTVEVFRSKKKKKKKKTHDECTRENCTRPMRHSAAGNGLKAFDVCLGGGGAPREGGAGSRDKCRIGI